MKKFWDTHAATIIMALLTLLGWAFVVGEKMTVLGGTGEEIKVLHQTDADLKRQHEELTGDVRELKTDVKWIRAALEKKP